MNELVLEACLGTRGLRQKKRHSTLSGDNGKFMLQL